MQKKKRSQWRKLDNAAQAFPAGQTVFHFHMHLIPRYEGDQVGLGWKMGELTEADKEEILNKIK